MVERTFHFEQALLPDGWAADVRLSVDQGMIDAVQAGVAAGPGDERHRVALPGLPNLHSHAFQRAMAGLAEVRGSGNMNLIGDTKSFRGEIVGSGDIRAFELKSEETTVKIVGSGDAEVYSSVKLNVNVAGSGDVRYKGGAQVDSHIAGSGGVKKLD